MLARPPSPTPPLRRAALGLALGAALLVLSFGLATTFATWWHHNAVEQRLSLERARAAALAQATAVILSQKLAAAHGAALGFSQGDDVREILSAQQDPARVPDPSWEERTLRLDRRLDGAARQLGLGLIAVANADGVVIASGEPLGIPSFVGQRYTDGPLHRGTRNGQSMRLFMVGETTGRRTVVFAEPVRATDGRYLGYVGVAAVLEETLLPTSPSTLIVTDRHGVIVLTNGMAAWRLRRLTHQPGWTPPDESPDWPLYGGTAPQPWTWLPTAWPDVWQIDPAPGGARMLESRAPLLGEVLQVHTLEPTTWLDELDHWRRLLQGLGTALVLSLLGLIAILAAGWWQTRHQRQALAALNEQLQRLATTDALTGCHNRRRLFELLDDELRRHQRSGRPLSVLSIDLDHFKLVNDRHGHAAGDDVLRHVVGILQNHLRTTDHLGRVGGEEFLVLLPETADEAARGVAEKLRQAVQAHPAPLAGGLSLPVTVSIGGVTATEPTQLRAAPLLDAADRALYAAKQAGRNRVCWADAVTSQSAG